MSLIPKPIRSRIEHRPNLIRILDNIGWLFLDKVLRMGVGLLIGVWVARHLGPEQFGLLNFIGALIGIFGTFAGMGMQGIVIREIVQVPEFREETLGTAMVLQFFAGLLGYSFLLATVGWLRPDGTAKAITLILGVAIILKSSDVVGHWFESQLQSRYTVWIQNVAFLLFAGAKVILILQNAPTIRFAWVMLAEAAAVAIALIITLNNCGPKLRTLRMSRERTRHMLNACWPLALSSIAIMVYMRIDQVMLAQMLGDDAAGIYSAAVRVSEIWYFISTAITTTVLPSVLELKKHCRNKYYESIQSLFDLMIWLAILFALPVTIFSTSIIKLLFGNTYSSAGAVLAIHVWSTMFVFLGVATGNWFLAENKQLISLQRTIIAALINISLNFILIPRLGITGAAWATLLAYAVAGMLSDAIHTDTRGIFLMKLHAFNLVKSFHRLKIQYGHRS